MKSVVFLCFIIWFADAERKARKGGSEAPRGALCTFKDRTFEPGDSWHPYLEPFGLLSCVRCVCTEAGQVKCGTIKCPPLLCENPVTEPQQCCPKCSSNQPRIPAGLRASAKSCRYNGTVYQPGETFNKHDLFPSKQSNQCVMCTCSNGNIFCALKTCQPITCSSPTSVPETCCLVCKDHSSSDSSSTEDRNLQLNRGVRHSLDQCSREPSRAQPDRATPPKVKTSQSKGFNLTRLNLRGASETTVKILMQRKHPKACLYNGKTYSHGDMWHPVLGKVLECILCACTDGLQECKRIMCPSQYPCQYPLKVAGKCCKTCPDDKVAGNQTQCYNKNNVLVYKVETSLKVDSHHTVRVIAVERPSVTEVEVLMWKAVEGVLQLMEIGDVYRKDIIDHPENYTLLTTLDEETWRRFREESEGLRGASQASLCEDGVREMVTFLNPSQMEELCSP